jgi:hypothetical protein
MALANYSDLKTAIGAWMFDQGSLLSSYYDDFIDAAESRFNYGFGAIGDPLATPPIRVRDMEQTASITVTSDSGSLPSDFLQMIRVSASTSPVRKLTYATPDWFLEAYPDGEADYPDFYTIIGSTIRTSTNVSIVYYEKIDALSDAATTNWLLTKSPLLYLSGCCIEAALFQGDRERAVEMAAVCASWIAGLHRADMFSRAGVLEMRANGQAP